MDDPLRARHRERYVRLCLECRSYGREAVEAELADAFDRLELARAALLEAVETIQQRPATWLERYWRPRTIEWQAQADLAALAALPPVGVIDADPRGRELLVSILGGPDGRPAPFDLRLRLADSAIQLDTRSWPWPSGDPPVLGQARRTALTLAATALLGTGDLAGLVSLVLGGSMVERRAQAETTLTASARQLYVGHRRQLLAGGAADDPQLQAAEQMLAREGERIGHLTRRACQAARCLHELDAGADRSAAAFRVEYDVLSSLPAVETIVVEQRSVRVTTSPIRVRHDGAEFDLGRFLLDLRPPSWLKVRNLDRPVKIGHRRVEHPHVIDGDPCTGNVAALIADRMSRYDHAAVIQHLLALLESYNPSSCFVRLEEHWPRAVRSAAASPSPGG